MEQEELSYRDTRGTRDGMKRGLQRNGADVEYKWGSNGNENGIDVWNQFDWDWELG